MLPAKQKDVWHECVIGYTLSPLRSYLLLTCTNSHGLSLLLCSVWIANITSARLPLTFLEVGERLSSLYGSTQQCIYVLYINHPSTPNVNCARMTVTWLHAQTVPLWSLWVLQIINLLWFMLVSCIGHTHTIGKRIWVFRLSTVSGGSISTKYRMVMEWKKKCPLKFWLASTTLRFLCASRYYVKEMMRY